MDEKLRLQAELAEKRAALAPIEAREKEAADARAAVRAIEDRIAEIEAAETRAIRERVEAEKKATDLIAWRELRMKCRDVKEKLEALEHEVLLLNEEAPMARGKVEGAERRLAEHLNNLLTDDDYPTESELDAERARGKRLQAAYDSAMVAQQELNRRRDGARMQWIRTRDALNALTWQENRLRPPKPPQAQAWVVGTLN